MAGEKTTPGGKHINPRWKSGKRRTYQQRFRAMQEPCAICGRPIDYSLPYYYTDKQGKRRVNSQAFVIDERLPVSKWQQHGYTSAAAAADDFTNLRPAHALCNAMRGNKEGFTIQTQQQATQKRKAIKPDGKW